MFNELDKIVKNFETNTSELEKDRDKRLETIKRIDELLGNYGSVSNEETTKYVVLGDKDK